jgi:hypothetical protein
MIALFWCSRSFSLLDYQQHIRTAFCLHFCFIQKMEVACSSKAFVMMAILHDMCQKTVIFIITAVITSNLIQFPTIFSHWIPFPQPQVEYAVFHHIIFDLIFHILEQEQCTISLLQSVIVSPSFYVLRPWSLPESDLWNSCLCTTSCYSSEIKREFGD